MPYVFPYENVFVVGVVVLIVVLLVLRVAVARARKRSAQEARGPLDR